MHVQLAFTGHTHSFIHGILPELPFEVDPPMVICRASAIAPHGAVCHDDKVPVFGTSSGHCEFPSRAFLGFADRNHMIELRVQTTPVIKPEACFRGAHR